MRIAESANASQLYTFIVPELEIEKDTLILVNDNKPVPLYLYDDLSNEDVAELVSHAINDTVDVSLQGMEKINVQVLGDKLDLVVHDIINHFMKRSLLEKYSYSSVTHELINDCKVDTSTNGKVVLIKLLICIHRESRAYGKVISLHTLYNIDTRHTIHLSASVVGNVSESNIAFFDIVKENPHSSSGSMSTSYVS